MRGYTQEEMSNYLSVSRQSYIKYESGEAEPSFETLKRISSILKTPIDDLLDNEIYPSQRNQLHQNLINELEAIIEKYK